MGTALISGMRATAKRRAVIQMMLAIIEDLEEWQLNDAVQKAESIIDDLRTPFVESREVSTYVSPVTT